MRNNHICARWKSVVHVQGFSKSLVGIMKWSLLSLGIASTFLSLSLIVGATPSSWALCGSDSDVQCSGGVRCTATDQVGCACYNSAGRVVEKHSCKEAAPDDEFFDLVEDPIN